MNIRKALLYSITFGILIVAVLIGLYWFVRSLPSQPSVRFAPVPAYPSAAKPETNFLEEGTVQITNFETPDSPAVVCAFYDRTLRRMKGWQHFERFRYFYADDTHPGSFLEVMATRISGQETRVELKQFAYDPHNPRLSARDQCASG